jgi:uncharacterized repeat protein (TIGR01451 family)
MSLDNCGCGSTPPCDKRYCGDPDGLWLTLLTHGANAYDINCNFKKILQALEDGGGGPGGDINNCGDVLACLSEPSVDIEGGTVTIIFADGTEDTFDVAGTDSVSTLVDNGDGTFIHTSGEDGGTPTILDVCQALEDGGCATTDSISTLVYNNDGTFTHTSGEDGATPTVVDICQALEDGDCQATVSIDGDTGAITVTGNDDSTATFTVGGGGGTDSFFSAVVCDAQGMATFTVTNGSPVMADFGKFVTTCVQGGNGDCAGASDIIITSSVGATPCRFTYYGHPKPLANLEFVGYDCADNILTLNNGSGCSQEHESFSSTVPMPLVICGADGQTHASTAFGPSTQEIVWDVTELLTADPPLVLPIKWARIVVTNCYGEQATATAYAPKGGLTIWNGAAMECSENDDAVVFNGGGLTQNSCEKITGYSVTITSNNNTPSVDPPTNPDILLPNVMSDDIDISNFDPDNDYPLTATIWSYCGNTPLYCPATQVLTCEEITLPPEFADVAVSKEVDNKAPEEGGIVVFTVTVTNTSTTVTATNVVVQDVLPVGLTYVSDNPSAGTTAMPNATTVDWTVGSMAPSATETLQITATVDAGTNGQSLINNVNMTADNDENESNNSDEAEVVPTLPIARPVRVSVVDDLNLTEVKFSTAGTENCDNSAADPLLGTYTWNWYFQEVEVKYEPSTNTSGFNAHPPTEESRTETGPKNLVAVITVIDGVLQPFDWSGGADTWATPLPAAIKALVEAEFAGMVGGSVNKSAVDDILVGETGDFNAAGDGTDYIGVNNLAARSTIHGDLDLFNAVEWCFVNNTYTEPTGTTCAGVESNPELTDHRVKTGVKRVAYVQTTLTPAVDTDADDDQIRFTYTSNAAYRTINAAGSPATITGGNWNWATPSSNVAITGDFVDSFVAAFDPGLPVPAVVGFGTLQDNLGDGYYLAQATIPYNHGGIEKIASVFRTPQVTNNASTGQINQFRSLKNIGVNVRHTGGSARPCHVEGSFSWNQSGNGPWLQLVDYTELNTRMVSSDGTVMANDPDHSGTANETVYSAFRCSTAGETMTLSTVATGTILDGSAGGDGAPYPGPWNGAPAEASSLITLVRTF